MRSEEALVRGSGFWVRGDMRREGLPRHSRLLQPQLGTQNPEPKTASRSMLLTPHSFGPGPPLRSLRLCEIISESQRATWNAQRATVFSACSTYGLQPTVAPGSLICDS